MRTLRNGVTIMDITMQNDDYTVDTKLTTTIKMTEYSDWRCELFGGPCGIVWAPVKGNEPNWFHRKMQELCFGVKWRKVK